MNNYTSNQATSDDPLDMVFTITNEGTGVIPTGDTVFFTFVIGTNYYAMDLTPGSVSYIVLAADLAPAASIDLSMLTTPPSTMSMDWIYTEMGGLNGNVCCFASVGEATLTLTPGADANCLGNSMCVNYTVTAVAGLDGVGTAYISAYPNTASGVINFQVGNNKVSQINIFDMNGRLVTSIAVTANIETLNTENMAGGVFYYQMMNGEEMVATEKFVVTK